MEPLSPLAAISGGLLIGSAAAFLLLTNGRIAGVSGMAATATGLGSGDTPRSQAIAFLIGLPIGTAFVAAAVRSPDVVITSSVPLLVVAGLLVGFGTRLGNGCTSGHGVCGLARLSPRSIAATATFMASAVVTLFVARNLFGA